MCLNGLVVLNALIQSLTGKLIHIWNSRLRFLSTYTPRKKERSGDFLNKILVYISWDVLAFTFYVNNKLLHIILFSSNSKKRKMLRGIIDFFLGPNRSVLLLIFHIIADKCSAVCTFSLANEEFIGLKIIYAYIFATNMREDFTERFPVQNHLIEIIPRACLISTKNSGTELLIVKQIFPLLGCLQ